VGIATGRWAFSRRTPQRQFMRDGAYVNHYCCQKARVFAGISPMRIMISWSVFAMGWATLMAAYKGIL
jgi:hypothetical protein